MSGFGLPGNVALAFLNIQNPNLTRGSNDPAAKGKDPGAPSTPPRLAGLVMEQAAKAVVDRGNIPDYVKLSPEAKKDPSPMDTVKRVFQTVKPTSNGVKGIKISIKF